MGAYLGYQSREVAERTQKELDEANKKLREQAAESERRQREQEQAERQRAADIERQKAEAERQKVAEAERQKAAEKKKKAEELLDEPWRKNRKNGWTGEEVSAMKNKVAVFAIPEDSGVEHFNILLLGTPSSGKTSLRNTVGSAFVDQILKIGQTGQDKTSVTKILRSYPVRKKTEDGYEKLGIKFWDTMGLDENLHMGTICKILDGKVPHETKLEGNIEEAKLRSESEIGIKHKVHCILFVVNATKLAALGDDLPEKIREITAEAEERGLPAMLVLTHVDKICQHVSKETSTVFKSPKIRNLVENVAPDVTGFPAYKIHPIRNYSTEGMKETSIDFLSLLLMTQVMECCQEYCHYLEDSQEDY